MKSILLIFFTCLYLAISAQDKLFFKNGKFLSTNIITIHKNRVIILDSNLVYKSINTDDILLLETKSNTIKLFKPNDTLDVKEKIFNNNIGIIFSDIFLTRLSVSYERFLNKNKHVGIALQIGYNFINQKSNIFNRYVPNYTNKQSDILWNTGLDLNYYLKENSNSLYLGPRIRYGYLFYSFPLIASSFQFQIGKRFLSENKRFTQNISLGIGIFKFLEQFPKNYYFSSFSLNYRLAVSW